MKKNVLKKFAAAALAAATVMSMSVMAFADEAGATANTGSVTITKYMSTSGAGATLSPEDYTGVAPTGDEYKLLKNVEFAYVKVGERVQVDTATSDSSQTEIQYTVTDENFLDAIGIEKAEVNKNFTQETLNEKVSSSANKTKVINFVNTYKGANKKSTDENGTASFAGLDFDALYVFAETDATNAALASDGSKVNVTKVSVPFLVSLPFTGNDGKTVTDLKVYPKNSTGNVDIDKEIESVGTTTINGKQANANIGDEITYKVTYSVPVPENGLTELKIVDTMDKGLTFTNEASNITVKDDNKVDPLTNATDYEVTLDPTTNKVTIDFAKYLDSLQKNSTEEFTITYKVKLNKSAVLGQTGNKNDVALVYKNNGETDSKTKTPDPDKEVKVFTYGIDLMKRGEDGVKLSEVEFKLTDGTNEIKVKKSGNDYHPSNNDGASSTVVTDGSGEIHIRGLKPGTYKLTETKTSNGYVLLKDPVVIVITPSNKADEAAKGVVSATVGGKEVTMIEDSGSATAKVPLTVVNSKGFDLPATGGRGIALFTIAGIAIVAAAGSLLFMRKRSK